MHSYRLHQFLRASVIHRRTFLVLLLALALVPKPLFAQTLTVRRNLADLTEQSSTIVRGRLLSARMERHPELRNLNIVVVTLKVDATLKGKPASTLTFRQFVWDTRHPTSGYRKGQELLILLNPVGELGLTSPAGMEQGVFQIQRGTDGLALAVNGRDNYGLFLGIPKQLQDRGAALSPSLAATAARHRRGPVRLETIEEIIRSSLR
jgi:hypothetical protein